MPYSHSSGSYATTRHFILSNSSLLQSQKSLQHNMACILYVSAYIYIQSIWPQMVVKHIHKSTWSRPMRELRDVPPGGCCGETMDLEGREPISKTLPHLSGHPNQIHQIQWVSVKEHRNRVRRYDTTWH